MASNQTITKWGAQTYEVAGQQVALPNSYAFNPPATVQITNPTGVMGPPNIPPVLAGPQATASSGVSPAVQGNPMSTLDSKIFSSNSPALPAMIGLVGGIGLLWWIFWSDKKEEK